MCGILAVYAPETKVFPDALSQGIQSLHHRGPDNQSIWISSNQNVGLAHARLSIIDLENGEQPLTNASQSCALVVNGEFYDYEAIRHQLISEGATFKTASDSEIALHLYEKHGVSCLEHLRGEFTFCLWDENTKSIFAARDRFGINPLYYAEHEGKLYIASEIKAILAAGFPANWDQDAYYSRSFFYRDRSLFKGIHQVPPGHFLLASPSGLRIQKYWDLNYPDHGNEFNGSIEFATEKLRSLLLNSVNTRLRSDVPVGVYLSGGIDSCAVLGMATELSDNPLETFTLSFVDKEYDEGDIARRVAKSVNAKHHEIKITQTDIADNFVSSIYHSENVCMNPHGVAKFLLSRYVRDLGFRVVLTGEGADEIFAGYSTFRHDLLNFNPYDENHGDYTAQVTQGLEFSTQTLDTHFIKDAMGSSPSWITPQMQLHEKISKLYKDKNAFYTPKSSVKQFLNYLDSSKVKNVHPVHAAMYTFTKSMLPNYVLMTLGDRMEMAHSLEGRVPFLDHHVAEFMAQLPIEMKIYNMHEKYILREAVKPYVIPEVYERKKHPFFAPPSVLNPKEKFHQLVQDTMRGNILNDMPFFDKAEVVKFLDRLPNIAQTEWATTEAILMELMSLTSLQYHFKLSS